MTDRRKTRVIYVSYDGAGEPLGRSQVIAYLQLLAADCEITLISFEKDRRHYGDTAAVLRDAGIDWRPLIYHRRPPVLSTLWDILAGVRVLRRACREQPPDIIHTRSIVPGVIALASRRGRRGGDWKLLFDARAFWADERVVAGSWRADGRLYRLVRRCELGCYRHADAVVTLTAASIPQIREWTGARPVPVTVIPTCADVEHFGGRGPRPDGPHAVWCGSIGAIYRFDLAVRFAAALALPLTVLTRQVELARRHLGGAAADVREVEPHAVAEELHEGDIGLCFYAESFANLARAPTRFAEYLAAGMPVALYPRIGDLDAIVRDQGIGVCIEDDSDACVERAAARIAQLAADPAARARGRRLAEELYSVEDGARSYMELYRALRADDPDRRPGGVPTTANHRSPILPRT